MLKTKKAFSLVELVLATAIMGIILISVYSSFSLAMRTYRRVKTKIDQQAVELLIPLCRQLRSCYIGSMEDPDFSFQGSLASLRFTTTAAIDDHIYTQGDTDLQKVLYIMSADQKTGKRVLNYETYDVLDSDKEKVLYKDIASSLQSISFSFYDGQQWQKGWDSTIQLPQAVKIMATFSEGVYKDSYETVVMISGFNKTIKEKL